MKLETTIEIDYNIAIIGVAAFAPISTALASRAADSTTERMSSYQQAVAALVAWMLS